MAKFKVEIDRVVRGAMGRNPFHPVRLSLNDKCTVHVRQWEFEAKDEKEVRRLFQEAVDKDLPNVRGYAIRTIKRLPDGDKTP